MKIIIAFIIGVFIGAISFWFFIPEKTERIYTVQHKLIYTLEEKLKCEEWGGELYFGENSMRCTRKYVKKDYFTDDYNQPTTTPQIIEKETIITETLFDYAF